MTRGQPAVPIGLVTIVAGIVSHLPEDKVEAAEGA